MRSPERIEEFIPQNEANSASAFATLGVRQEELLGAIARRALVRLEEFKPQALANTAWAFAKLGVRHEELLGGSRGGRW